jgi:hypothetical protein
MGMIVEPIRAHQYVKNVVRPPHGATVQFVTECADAITISGCSAWVWVVVRDRVPVVAQRLQHCVAGVGIHLCFLTKLGPDPPIRRAGAVAASVGFCLRCGQVLGDRIFFTLILVAVETIFGCVDPVIDVDPHLSAY